MKNPANIYLFVCLCVLTFPGFLLSIVGYVPDGMTPEEYAALRKKELEEAKKKKYGAYGPQSFVSRSLQSFQTEMEKGRASHLMPVMFAKKKLASGKIKAEDVPYMQRLGAWDNSDVAGAKKKEWNEKDKRYNQNASPSGGPQSVASDEGKSKNPKRFGLF